MVTILAPQVSESSRLASAIAAIPQTTRDIQFEKTQRSMWESLTNAQIEGQNLVNQTAEFNLSSAVEDRPLNRAILQSNADLLSAQAKIAYTEAVHAEELTLQQIANLKANIERTNLAAEIDRETLRRQLAGGTLFDKELETDLRLVTNRLQELDKYTIAETGELDHERWRSESPATYAQYMGETLVVSEQLRSNIRMDELKANALDESGHPIMGVINQMAIEGQQLDYFKTTANAELLASRGGSSSGRSNGSGTGSTRGGGQARVSAGPSTETEYNPSYVVEDGEVRTYRDLPSAGERQEASMLMSIVQSGAAGRLNPEDALSPTISPEEAARKLELMDIDPSTGYQYADPYPVRESARASANNARNQASFNQALVDNKRAFNNAVRNGDQESANRALSAIRAQRDALAPEDRQQIDDYLVEAADEFTGLFGGIPGENRRVITGAPESELRQRIERSTDARLGTLNNIERRSGFDDAIDMARSDLQSNDLNRVAAGIEYLVKNNLMDPAEGEALYTRRFNEGARPRHRFVDLFR